MSVSVLFLQGLHAVPFEELKNYWTVELLLSYRKHQGENCNTRKTHPPLKKVAKQNSNRLLKSAQHIDNLTNMTYAAIFNL